MKGCSQYYLYDHRTQRFHELKDGFVLGRMEGNLKFPGDDLMSRSHCRFHISGNDFYVEDLKSTNHTRVNTVGIRSGVKRRIQLNDLIECGIQRFTLTHQNRFPPANMEDKTRGRKIYKAKKLEDGSLQAQMSRVFTKPTLVVLDKYRYHALRVKQFLAPLFERKPSVRIRPAVQAAVEDRRVHRLTSAQKRKKALLSVTAGLVAGLFCAAFLFKGDIAQVSRSLASQHCQTKSESPLCQGFAKRGWIQNR